jgi:Protein of unknown function (DUF1549)/Protein of unknown function (DUF1553)
MNLPKVFLLLLLTCGSISDLRAEDELLPSDRSINEVVDQYINAKLLEQQIEPAEMATDEIFLRRLTLDLAGRIPTKSELDAYHESADPGKKAQTIERLLNSPDFAYHQRNRLDELLLADVKKDNAWREYLLKSVQANKPWDKMFREMMIGDQDDPAVAPALEFLKARVDDVNQMTNDTAKLFFGVSINCAQCHDHPLAPDWLQDHYFGFASFFNRSYRTKSDKLAEKFDGSLKFRTTKGEEKTAAFMFLTSVTVQEPKLTLTDEQKKQREKIVKASTQDEKAPLPQPEFSPRTKFVEIALAEENRSFFAQAIVNRMWASLFGTGIIDPPDQNHSGNTPSHPRLLHWLERDLETHHYDLKRLIGGIVASDAYARSSIWNGDEAPAKMYFAVAQVRPLTPRQYSLSLLVGTHNSAQLPTSVEDPNWADLRKNWENAAEGFADQLEQPKEDFQVSVDEALLFSNNERIDRDYLRDSGDKLVGQLKSIESPAAQIATAFQTTLSREPAQDETSIFLNYLEARTDRPLDGLKQIVWILITSPEMRFNY